MKNSFFEALTNDFQRSLTNLNLNECRELLYWVKKRIKYLEKIPHTKKKIEDMNLSIRAFNALKKNNLHTIEDILRYGIDQIHLIRNIGLKTANEIKQAIEGQLK